MLMAKEEFQTKIESGQTIRYGCTSFYKDGRYYYSRWTTNVCGEGTESFESFEELWSEVSHYFLYGMDYSGKDKSRNRRMNNLPVGDPPALDYDPKKFNPAATCGESIILNYYGPKQDLIIWFDPFPKAVTVDQLVMPNQIKEIKMKTRAPIPRPTEIKDDRARMGQVKCDTVEDINRGIKFRAEMDRKNLRRIVE